MTQRLSEATAVTLDMQVTDVYGVEVVTASRERWVRATYLAMRARALTPAEAVAVAARRCCVRPDTATRIIGSIET